MFSFFWLVQQPFVVNYVLESATTRSDWDISLEKLRIKPFSPGVELTGLKLQKKEADTRISLSKANLSLNVFGFLQGKLSFDEFAVQNLFLHFPEKKKKEETKHKKLNTKQLLLLQSLAIETAQVSLAQIEFGNQKSILIDEAEIVFNRDFFGKSTLHLKSNGLVFESDSNRVFHAGSISLLSKTKLESWEENFPYLNNISGELNLQDGDIEHTPIDKLNAKVSLNNAQLELSPLLVTINKRNLSGKLNLDLEKENFKLNIDIPEAISLPHLGKKSDVFNSGGNISGSVQLAGNGFLPSTSSGSGKIELHHLFHTSADIENIVSAEVQWINGNVALENALLTSGEAKAQLSGSINIKRKNMDLAASSESFPLENVFLNFEQEDLQKIHGLTSFDLHFTGWGKKFLLAITATTNNGGWDQIAIEKIESDFNLTYEKLELASALIQENKTNGTANLVINYGKKNKLENRSKDIQLSADIDKLDLTAPLEKAYGLTGKANAHFTLSGSETNFTGKIKAVVNSGSYFSVPFNQLTSQVNLSRHKIVFDHNQILLSRSDTVHSLAPVYIDIGEREMKIYGNPYPGVSLDMRRNKSQKSWNFNHQYKSPQKNELLSFDGSISEEGNLNLGLKGNVDLSLITFIPSLVREANGPAKIDLTFRGNSIDPLITGSIQLEHNLISPRTIPLRMEEVNGSLVFNQKKIQFNNVQAEVDSGSFTLNGYITHKNKALDALAIDLIAHSLTYRSNDRTVRLEFDGDLHLNGNMPSPLLSGNISLLDGRYTEDFNITDVLTEGKRRLAKKIEEEEIIFDPKLDLKIKNSGDFFIKNNIGDIGLNIDIAASGTRQKPNIKGVVKVEEGTIYYLGLNFEIIKGFIELRAPYNVPYLELKAQKEVNAYNVNLDLYGTTDNLNLDLSATSASGPLEKRDVISLIAYGITESERQELARENQKQGSFSTQIIASQITSIIERPVSRFAHLDIFRLEAADNKAQGTSRVFVGKQLSDRLSIDFSTDINTEDAEQTITTEYLITDNLLIKGIQGNKNRYGLVATIRFRLR